MASSLAAICAPRGSGSTSVPSCRRCSTTYCTLPDHAPPQRMRCSFSRSCVRRASSSSSASSSTSVRPPAIPRPSHTHVKYQRAIPPHTPTRQVSACGLRPPAIPAHTRVRSTHMRTLTVLNRLLRMLWHTLSADAYKRIAARTNVPHTLAVGVRVTGCVVLVAHCAHVGRHLAHTQSRLRGNSPARALPSRPRTLAPSHMDSPTDHSHLHMRVRVARVRVLVCAACDVARLAI